MNGMNGKGGMESGWIRVDQDGLNSRRRRKISRGLRRLVNRERNGMARLLQELRRGIRAEINEHEFGE